MNYEMLDVFQFLPQETIKASELKRGNIVKIHARYELVIDSKTEEDNYNNGWNQQIELLHGTAYLPTEHEVSIVKRELVNESIKEFIDAHLKQQEEWDKLREQEEEEERQREIEYLEDRLRGLKD